MSDERLEVLNMVETGQISTEEALQLLDALNQTKASGETQAKQMYERAVELDPNFAVALARLGYISTHIVFLWGHRTPERVSIAEQLSKAKAAIDRMRETYNRRRLLMSSRLKELGFKIHVMPTGAFYVFADARAFC